jgi:hypothetical protein
MFIKKFFPEKLRPIRFLYEDLYGTTIGPWDELYYIWICLLETVRILIYNFVMKYTNTEKNFAVGKNYGKDLSHIR